MLSGRVIYLSAYLVAFAVVLAAGPVAEAAIIGIDNVTLGAGNTLVTATVGGTAYNGGAIADVAQDDYPSTGLNSATTGGAIITGDANVPLSWDDDVLTGSSGGQGEPATNGILQLFWGSSGGGFTDNDSDPDFFVFEDLGNDSVVVRAILSDDTYGAPVPLSGWNSVRTDGVLNYTTTGRTVAGVAFDFTDLKDASSANLSNGTTVKGIWIGQVNAADFYEVYANVSVIPEPSILSVLALGGLLTVLRRRRQ